MALSLKKNIGDSGLYKIGLNMLVIFLLFVCPRQQLAMKKKQIPPSHTKRNNMMYSNSKNFQLKNGRPQSPYNFWLMKQSDAIALENKRPNLDFVVIYRLDGDVDNTIIKIRDTEIYGYTQSIFSKPQVTTLSF